MANELEGNNGERKLLAAVLGLILAGCLIDPMLAIWNGHRSRDLTVERAIEASAAGANPAAARARLYMITKLAIAELRRAAESGDAASTRLLGEVERLLR